MVRLTWLEGHRWNSQSIGQGVGVISTDHATLTRRIFIQHANTANKSKGGPWLACDRYIFDSFNNYEESQKGHLCSV